MTQPMNEATVGQQTAQKIPTFQLTQPLSELTDSPQQTDLQRQVEALLSLSKKQQSSIQELIEVVDRLVSTYPSPVTEGPFEWLPHSQYITIYPRIVSAMTSGLPKQKTLITLLGINPGGSADWTKASRDWDRLKVILSH